MTFKIALLAAPLAALLSLPSQARAPESQGWLILAQSGGATCALEGQQVPNGTRVCREGYIWRCIKSGRWDRTSKPC